MTLDLRKLVNTHFHKLLYNESRYLLLVGSAGSGKSHFAAQKIILRCLTSKQKYLIVRKTSPAVRDSCYALIKDYLIRWEIPHIATDLKFVVGNSVILLKGLDDPEKIKSIEGITSIWIEEANTITAKDFEQLDLRLRGDLGTYKQIILSFNPSGGKQSWIYRKFFSQTNEFAYLDKSTWRDNEFIDKEYIEKLAAIDDANFKKIYSDGEWAELSHQIYSRATINNSLDISKIIEKTNVIYGGVDFGWSDPNVFLLIAEVDKDVYVLKEYYKSKELNADFANAIVAILRDLKLTNIFVHCDDSEPDKISELNSIMSRASVGKALPAHKKSVLDGINEVKKHHIFINSECVKSCEQIPAYSYKEDKDGNVLEVPVDYNDHTCDSLRYGVYGNSKRGGILYV